MSLNSVPSVDMSEVGVQRRRWSDRPGRIPGLTFARFLATGPTLDEATRFLVGLLSWPVSASGAFILRTQADNVEFLGHYEEAAEEDNFSGCTFDASAEEFRQALDALRGAEPVLWTDAEFPGCRPLAVWPLGVPVTGNACYVLVVTLAYPWNPRVVSERMVGIADVLSIYVAGVTLRQPPGSSVGALSDRQSEVLLLMSQELTLAQIAQRIGFSESTVRMESLAIYRALDVHDRRSAVERARTSGLLMGGALPA